MQKPVLKPVHWTCLVYLVFWFWTSQVIRYLMIILPLMSLCTLVVWAEGISWLLRPAWLRMQQGRAARLLAHSGTISLGLVLLVTAYLSVHRIKHDLKWIALTPQDQHEALLHSQAAYAPALAASADERIAKGPILQFQLPEIRWFYSGVVYGDWMGRYRFQDFAHIGPSEHWEMNPGSELIQQVKAIGAVAVVFRKDPDIQFSPQPLESYRQDFEIIEESDSTVLMIPR